MNGIILNFCFENKPPAGTKSPVATTTTTTTRARCQARQKKTKNNAVREQKRERVSERGGEQLRVRSESDKSEAKKNDKKNVYTASWDSKEKVWTHKYHYAEFILLPILLLLSLLSFYHRAIQHTVIQWFNWMWSLLLNALASDVCFHSMQQL